MRRIKKLLLFLFILPVTVFFDFILFSLTRNCPSCGSFSQWLASEAALSFPLVVSLSDFLNTILTDLQIVRNKK